MKLSTYVITFISGAAIAALSFLFVLIDNPDVQNLRWILFAIGLAVAVVSLVFIIVLLVRRKDKPLLPDGAEYRKKRSIMTAPEVQLYRVLCSSLDLRKCMVLPQVALLSVIDKISGGGYRSELFRIADFCIVDSNSFMPLLVIELNDASHSRDDRKLRDEKVAAICADAHLPLFTVDIGRIHDVRWLKSELRRLL